MLQNWAPGIGAIATINANTLDFYFSFGLGLTAAIAVIGIWHVISGLLQRKTRGRREREDRMEDALPPAARARGLFDLGRDAASISL